MSMWLGLLVGLLLTPSGGWLAQPRYACDLQPGPPVRVRVYRAWGRLRVPVGPELAYRHPGKMASAADIDGDGNLDLLVLVHKITRYDPKPAWRPFVYTLAEGQWVPKWLGSRVGRPLLEAALVHTRGGVRLLTIEEFGEGETGLTLYHWRGFGFWGEWTGEPGPPQSGLQVVDAQGDGIDEVSVCIGESRHTYACCDGGYTPVAEECEEE
jgi:hypothetical protein